jgi:hypothetical protein
MAPIRTWPVALGLLLVLPAVAEASFKYRTEIRFSGTYTQDDIDGGTVIGHVQSATTFTVRDARLVVTTKAGAIALYPSGHTTARLATKQSGFRIACDASRQAFTDRIAHRPGRGWVTLKRKGSRATLGFGWSGESVDRTYARVVEGDCEEPAGVDEGAGNDDEAGAAGMAERFGIRLRVPLSSLMKGRSISRKITVHKVDSDVADGFGVRARLDGSYRVVLSRVG